MSDDNKSKMSGFMDQLQALDKLANEMDNYSDILGELPDMDSDISEMELTMNNMDIMSAMGRIGGMPSMNGMNIPGKPIDIGIYDEIIVHGLNGNYRLSFEENEEGLTINAVHVD